MNHRVTHWIHFLGFEASGDGRDNATRIIPFTPQPFSYELLRKYYYYQQLSQAFPTGAVFRSTQSSLDGDMTWTYGIKPHLVAATARNPDGSWSIGIQNFTSDSFSGLQGMSDEKWNSTQNGHTPATGYNVKLSVTELSTGGNRTFRVYRTNATETNAPAETVAMANGIVTVTVAPLELVTLREAGKETATR